MAIRIPYGIDPDELWEVDYCAESARLRLRLQRESAESMRRSADLERDEAKRAVIIDAVETAKAQARETEADLAAYTPESGPVFQVTAIPARKRAALIGRKAEADAMSGGEARAVALVEWARDVVRAAVRGHRNLRRASGAEVPYSAADGQPDERTLEAYGQILVDLAWVVLLQQRLGPDGKNA